MVMMQDEKKQEEAAKPRGSIPQDERNSGNLSVSVSPTPSKGISSVKDQGINISINISNAPVMMSKCEDTVPVKQARNSTLNGGAASHNKKNTNTSGLKEIPSTITG